MKKTAMVLSRTNFGISRRGFVRSGCALCAGLMAGTNVLRAEKTSGKLRIRVIFVMHAIKQNKPDWPYLGFDFAPVLSEIKNTLTNAFPDIEFLFSTATGAVQANAILAKDLFSRINGYIVYQMNNWNLVVQSIVATDKPVLFVDYTYGGSGGVLVYSAMLSRAGVKNLGVVCSQKTQDIISAVKCFELLKSGASASDFARAVTQVRKERTPSPGDLTFLPDPVPAISIDEVLARMAESKILAVGYPGVSLLGIRQIPMEKISFAELNSAWKEADQDHAFEIAKRWQNSAHAVRDVSEETLISSAKMYLGMKSLLKKHQANAITINCLVGFYSKAIQAYPCLGFYELNNEGLVGACECDVRSAATMLAVNFLTNGRPGYISDPVLDSSERRIIYAHCVASNRVFGPDGPENPIEILTHSEDRKGASVRSILPSGYIVTTLEFAPEKKQVLLHQAKAIGNDPNDRACRTKLVAEPIGDFEKLFTMWDLWGWHRVTVYGDLKEQVFALADRLGYQVIQEA